MLRLAAATAAGICRINRLVGEVFAWLSLGVVLVCFTVVVQRYVFGVSYLWMQDLYVWLSGAMFTVVAGFALMRDDHVRVDIFYRPARMRRRAVVDLLGTLLFLWPFTAVVAVYSIPFVRRSWAYGEGSANVGGMPGLYILKTFILAFAFLLALQGLATVCRSALVLANRRDLVPEAIRYPETGADAEAAALEGTY